MNPGGRSTKAHLADLDYERQSRYPPCPSFANGRHQPDNWREWRTAKIQGVPVSCRCGQDIWPTCDVCGEPEEGWQSHDHG